MKKYLTYFKVNFIYSLQYRASAYAGICTQFFFGFLYIMLYLAFYGSNKGASTPMPLNDLITYVWLQQSFFVLVLQCVNDRELVQLIKNGNLAYEIVKPQNFYFKYLIKFTASRFSAVVLRAPLIIIVSLILPKPYNLSLPCSFKAFIIFIIALFISCFLTCAIGLIFQLLVIFLKDETGILALYRAVGDIFSGTCIPLAFFPGILKKIAYALPFKYISDFPFRVYFGDIAISEGITLLYEAIIWLIIFIVISNLLAKVALRKAVIQGG